MAWNSASDSRRTLILCALLALGTLAAFWPVHRFDFTNYDDNYYIYDNPIVRNGLSLGTIKWALTTTWFSYWHPITWLSHALDCQLFGLRPGAHHLMSLLLHLVNTLCLFLTFRQMTGATQRSALVAALFALHPMHVESVAWLAERKDVLSGLFWILTMWAYAWYAKRRSIPRYTLTLALYTAGLMSKPMVVTLPCVLLLLDYWPLKRLQLGKQIAGASASFLPDLWKLFREKIPFFLLSAATSVIAYVGTKNAGNVLSAEALPWSFRLTNVPISYARYLGKLILPENLAVLYPIPEGWQVWQVAGASVLLLVLCLFVLAFVTSRPYLVVGWLWFLGTLVPTLSLVAVGYQSLADRYTYIPYIGLFVMMVWGVTDASKHWRNRAIVLPVGAVVMLSFCLILTRKQLNHWQNSLALWGHTVKVTQNNAIAQYNLGHALHHSGYRSEATPFYLEALRINPDQLDANLNLGVLYRESGQLELATNYFGKTLKLRAQYHKAHVNMGIALFELGDLSGATNSFATAVELAPHDPIAQFNYALALLEVGDAKGAEARSLEALRLEPSYAEAHTCLGKALAAQDRPTEALTHLNEAIRLKPNSEEARLALGMELIDLGRSEAGIAQLTQLLDIHPNSPEALNQLAWVRATHPLDELRSGQEALRLAERACDQSLYREPAFLATWAAAQAEVGQYPQAAETAARAQKLALSLGRAELVRRCQALGDQFKQGKPWRTTTTKPQH